ncbi:MAG: copper homeostasis protein CutC [Propionibacteriales bacterium]|nr:copper homeostasis protein CutC [Propionibacteriales bacterium]
MEPPPLLEVRALHPADAEASEEGGADRIQMVGSPDDGGMSCETARFSAVLRSTSLPVRAMLRLGDGYGTTGGELSRLIGMAADYLAVGAEGVVFGFLNRDLRIDVPVCETLADAVSGTPWTFHRAIDHTLESDRAWRELLDLPGLDSVLTAGAARGVDHGLEELTRRAAAHPDHARLMVAGGGLKPEHVPWLTRSGVRAFHVGSSVRPGGSWTKSSVDASYVRSWRLLLDDHVAHAVTS